MLMFTIGKFSLKLVLRVMDRDLSHLIQYSTLSSWESVLACNRTCFLYFFVCMCGSKSHFVDENLYYIRISV